ncbi:MAG: SUF system NifU family Fe-S cluster assembly protein [Gammaproteobacteria bacterium]|nr:MAG: SUF system NifU family Fe-S cluster assembly protein [Gammaproteobacteria bacterium]
MSDDRMQRYSEIIIEHSQFPRHHGTLENPTHEAYGENPFCGDRIKLQFVVNDGGVIEQAVAESVGCAISIASASLLATHLHGLSLQQAEELFDQIHAAILEGSDEKRDQQLGELAALTFAGRYPSRVKCATLPWHVLRHALTGDESVASTE